MRHQIIVVRPTHHLGSKLCLRRETYQYQSWWVYQVELCSECLFWAQITVINIIQITAYGETELTH